MAADGFLVVIQGVKKRDASISSFAVDFCCVSNYKTERSVLK
jgi:hypothetical protein